MIDFANGKVFKLGKVDKTQIDANINRLLIDGENIISSYRGIRDYVVFTNKRIIAVNVQGITGKKKDYSSLPYSKISAYSVETAGTFDLDSELEVYLSGVGRVKLEFKAENDIIEISKIISEHLL